MLIVSWNANVWGVISPSEVAVPTSRSLQDYLDPDSLSEFGKLAARVFLSGRVDTL